MNYWMRIMLAASLICLYGGDACSAQGYPPREQLVDKARQEYLDGNFVDAERDFRELVKGDPTNIDTQIYLGHALFRQQKYSEAVTSYEKARDLEASGNKISSDQHRILVDQLAMAYGSSGDLKRTRTLLQSAIRDDPEYPLNYYNLACAYAEEGDKSKALINLSLALQRKEHILRGEQMPNPRTDSSFRKYIRDEDFIKVTEKFGY